MRVLALVVLAGMTGCGGAPLQDISPSAISGPTLTVPQINAQRDAYVGVRVAVVGRIVAQEQKSLGPCDVVSGEGCSQVAKVTLFLVNPDNPDGDDNRLDVYRQTGADSYQPAECRILGPGRYDCGIYVPNQVTVVQGIFTKASEPVQQVIYPGGRVDVLRSEPVYVLVVQ